MRAINNAQGERKTIPMWNSSRDPCVCWVGWGVGERIFQRITICLVSTILGTMRLFGNFRTVSKGKVLVFFNRHSITMTLVEEKQRVPISHETFTQAHQACRQRSLYSLISYRSSGLLPLIFLNLVDLNFGLNNILFRYLRTEICVRSFRAKVPNWRCIFQLRPNQSLICNFLSTLRYISQVPTKETKVS